LSKNATSKWCKLIDHDDVVNIKMCWELVKSKKGKVALMSVYMILNVNGDEVKVRIPNPSLFFSNMVSFKRSFQRKVNRLLNGRYNVVML